MTQDSWRSRPFYILITLTLVNAINWADRQVVPILVPSIKQDLGLSDTELGLIGGVAFSLIYAVAAFVFGFLADRGSRRGVILFGLICWSAATAASGLATGFWSLFAARFVTGIGEASLYPCAMSLLQDAYPAEKRGRAIGLIGASTALGSGLGIGLGGSLVTEIGWRNVFISYGAVGLLAIPLLLVMIEPKRHHDHTAKDHDPPQQIVGDALRDVRLMSIWFTGMVMLTAATGWVTWAPTYFTRDLGFDLAETGLIFGIAQLFGGVAGSLLGGRLGDSFRKKRFAGQLRVSAICAALTAPLVGVALLDNVPHAVLLAAAVLGPFVIYASLPNLQSMVAEIVPPKRLGLTFAVHMLFLAGAGSALGPFLVGWASDATGSLRTALMVPLIAAALSAVGAIVSERIVRARPPQVVS
jgi:MFS transporter, Spinster family, sphingosine-1-phosphate transporter